MSTSEETLFLLPRKVETATRPSRIRVIAAFAAIYLIWGSTYRGIALAVSTLSPLLLVGIRFLVAGAVLYGVARWNGAPRPSRLNWAIAILAGVLLFVIGNGTLSYVEYKKVPSGIAALFIATIPLWIVMLNWVWPGGVRPTARKFLGVTLGLMGIALLAYLERTALGAHVLMHSTLLILAAFSWAVGTIVCAKTELARSPAVAAAMPMLMGGALAVVLGLIENHDKVQSPSWPSLAARGYLTVFGSLIAFTSYNWLLKVTTPTRASSFAYVNPVVALFFGEIGDVSVLVIIPAIFIVAAVVMVGGERELTRTNHSPERSRR